MNPEIDQDILPQAGTSIWLKRHLLFLLFGSCLAGYVFSYLSFKPSLKTACEIFNTKITPNTLDLGRFSGLLENAHFGTQSNKTVIFQGMLSNEHGDTLIMINGRLAVKDAVVDGVRVVDITKSNAQIECKGEIITLYPGESITVE